MEGPPIFVLCDPAGKKVGVVPFDVADGETSTIGNLRNAVLSRFEGLLKVAPKEQWLLLRDQQVLPLDARVFDVFPEAKQQGSEMVVTLVVAPQAQAAPPLSHHPVQHPIPARANLEECALKAAKVVKAMGRLPEKRMVNFLLEQCNEATLNALAGINKPPSVKTGGGSGGSGGGRGAGNRVDVRQLEWTKFYNAIKDNVRLLLKSSEQRASQSEAVIVVDQAFLLQELARENNGVLSLALMKQWVKGANEAVGTSQRFVIVNCITLGNRLQEVRNYWEHAKHLPEFRDLHTLERFYECLGLDFTIDYIRKLINIAKLATLFPNLALISCCGIGELIKFAPEFMEFMKVSPQDALFWRTTPNGSFGWTRTTTLTAGEGGKKRRLFDFPEQAPQESHSAWSTRGLQQLNEMLAEDAAASQLAQEAQGQQDELIQEAIVGLEK